jgi:hypothetical protein
VEARSISAPVLPLLLAAASLLAACSSTQQSSNDGLATTRVALDRDQYTLRRIGVLPIESTGWRADEKRAFQAALVAEFSSRWHAEIVPLDPDDASGTSTPDSFRTGRIEPPAIVTIARRHNLDGLVAVTVTDRRAYPPQRLGLEVELTACDTGLPIWAASLRLDAATERTRDALRDWFDGQRSKDPSAETWDLCLLSPQRFAEFAAAQVAQAW